MTQISAHAGEAAVLARMRGDKRVEIADALLAAEEILEVLHNRGTRGVEQECNAGRIADVYQKVRAAKRRLT